MTRKRGAPPRAAGAPRATFEDEGTPRAAQAVSVGQRSASTSGNDSSPLVGSEIESLRLESFQLLHRIQVSEYSGTRLAKLTSTGALVSIKSISKLGLHDANEYDLLKSEVLNHLRVQEHPFVLGFHGAFVDQAAVHLVHEFCPAGDLSGLIEEAAERGHGMGEAAVKVFAAEVVLALDDIHSQGIIFRNLNPDNVLLDSDGHARLTNFGASKRVPEGGRTLTQCGTEDYLAPEILQNLGYTNAVDWWAFGVLLFEMVTGYRPFASDSKEDLLAEAIIRNQPRWPTSGMGPKLRMLLEHLLCSSLNVRLALSF